MSFSAPWVLLFLLIPVALGWWWRGSRSRIALPFDHVEHRRRRLLAGVLALTHTAPLVIMSAAIVILAGPKSLQQPGERRLLTNIQLVMDVSGSMGLEEPTRYERARAAIEEFTHAREGDAMGLTLFGEDQIRWVPITTDLAAIRNALPFAHPDRQPARMIGTRVGAALKYAAAAMETESLDGDRVIVLVSDGASPDIRNGAHFEVADVLREANITLYYLHVAEEDPPQPEAMELASLTGGRGFVARDPEATLHVFRHLDRLRPARFEPRAAELTDNYRWPVSVLLGAVAVHLAGLLGLRYTPW